MSKLTATVSKVLRIKDHEKEYLEMEVRNITKLIDAEKERLMNMEEAYKDAVERFYERHNNGNLNVNDIGLFYNYLSQLHMNIQSKKEDISKRLGELSILQNSLLEAYKGKKAFEMLKNKIEQEGIRQQDINEQKNTDFNFLSKRMVECGKA